MLNVYLYENREEFTNAVNLAGNTFTSCRLLQKRIIFQFIDVEDALECLQKMGVKEENEITVCRL